MNAKLCKRLRKVAVELSGRSVTEVKAIQMPSGSFALDPVCGRAVYRRLKKEFRE